MQIDLTQAAYRVLRRAGQPNYIPSPGRETMLTPPKVLISLFEEEESRAAVWLADAGLSEEQFRSDSGIGLGTVRLQSSITGPLFATGSYGVAPGSPGTEGIGAATAARDAHFVSVSAPDSEVGPRVSPQQQPPRPAAEYTHAPPPDVSVHWLTEARQPKAPPPYTFCLDGEQPYLGRFAPELLDALGSAVARLAKRTSSGESESRSAGIASRSISSAPRKLPHPFATEHLLFVLSLEEGRTGAWLREQGIDPANLLERLEKLYAEPPTGLQDFHIPDPIEPDTQCKGNARPWKSIAENTNGEDLADRANRDVCADKSLRPANVALPRLLDAAANRAREALRVLEDYARFVLDDKDLTARLKGERHQLVEQIREMIPQSRLIAARNTPEDVGTGLETEGETRRETLDDVLAANFSRLQEALRTLEEFSKINSPDCSRRFKRSRYDVYGIQKEFAARRGLLAEPPGLPGTETVVGESSPPRERLRTARLYVLVDCRESEEAFAELVRKLIGAGVDVIQLRDKKADDTTLLGRSQILRELTRSAGVPFIMNDRADLALQANADGVHYGQEDLRERKTSVVRLRDMMERDMLVGVSTHSMEQARQAVLDGADYIGVGPVFPSRTKDFDTFADRDFLRQVTVEIGIPAFAIGGIGLENIDEVLVTGICRIAVGSAVVAAEEPETAVRSLLESLREPHQTSPADTTESPAERPLEPEVSE